MKLLLLSALLLPIPQLSAQEAQVEDFDAPGSAWSGTIFSDLRPLGGAMLVREPLSTAQGAPDTDPPLPINAGGDAEGRMFEATAPASHAYALTENVPSTFFQDGAISAHAAFGVTGNGSQHFGLLLRTRIDPNPPSGSGFNAYTAYVTRSSGAPGTGTMALARWRNGVITASDQFVVTTFAIDPGAENYRIEFRVEGTTLSAHLWRLTATGGRVVTTPIVLAGGNGALVNELVAQDPELLFGRAGIDTFSRGPNSVFVDDVVLKPEQRHRRLGSGLGVAPPGPPWLPLPWAPLGGAWELRSLPNSLGRNDPSTLRIRPHTHPAR